jgi:predicted phosphodiesterase
MCFDEKFFTIATEMNGDNLIYAFFSDIHGNYPALLAALADARANGAERFVFLGDYVEDFPWPNEVVETIRAIPGAIVVRGNKELYLRNMKAKNHKGISCENFLPIEWSYNALTADNLDYLFSLPETLDIDAEDGFSLRLVHVSDIFFRKERVRAFHSSAYAERMKAAPFTHAEYLEYAANEVLACPDVVADIGAVPCSVYAYGHNHMQWHMEYGGKLFINPGGCGLPLDWNPAAPYTIIERADGGAWRVAEFRAPYDAGALLADLAASGMYAGAPVWFDIFTHILRTGEDLFGPLVRHCEAFARERGEPGMPLNDETWRMAVDCFEPLNQIRGHKYVKRN